MTTQRLDDLRRNLEGQGAALLAEGVERLHFDAAVQLARSQFNEALIAIPDALPTDAGELVELFGRFSGVKSGLGKLLMTAFWLDRVFGEDHPEPRAGLVAGAQTAFSELRAERPETDLSTVYACLLQALKNSFGAGSEEDANHLFSIAMEALNADPELRGFLHDLGNSAAHDIPAEVYTSLNDGLFEGKEGALVDWARGDLLDTVFKAARRAQQDMVRAIADYAGSAEGDLVYADYATGGGRIVRGVKEALGEDAGRLRMLASDSAAGQEESFLKSLGNQGITFERCNMAEVACTPENKDSLNMLSQAIGLHHLHPTKQAETLASFAHVTKPGERLFIADVYRNPLKILAALGDDLSNPEDSVDIKELVRGTALYYDEDCQLLEGSEGAAFKRSLRMLGKIQYYPELQDHEGHQTGLYFRATLEVVEERLA